MNNLYFEASRKPHAVYEVFQKNGHTYECLIAPKEPGTTGKAFQVTCRNIHQPDMLSFLLTPSTDGHWIPDNTRAVDPWMADRIGRIIINNY